MSYEYISHKETVDDERCPVVWCGQSKAVLKLEVDSVASLPLRRFIATTPAGQKLISKRIFVINTEFNIDFDRTDVFFFIRTSRSQYSGKYTTDDGDYGGDTNYNYFDTSTQPYSYRFIPARRLLSVHNVHIKQNKHYFYWQYSTLFRLRPKL